MELTAKLLLLQCSRANNFYFLQSFLIKRKRCGSLLSLQSIEAVCEDVDECEETPSLCGAAGRCLNTAGGFQCQCGPGYSSTEDGRGCVDTRRGLCYQRSVRGRCEAGGSTPVTMSDCCCTMGQAWGPDCQTCPRRGSPQYRELCPLGRDIDECKTSESDRLTDNIGL